MHLDWPGEKKKSDYHSQKTDGIYRKYQGMGKKSY